MISGNLFEGGADKLKDKEEDQKILVFLFVGVP